MFTVVIPTMWKFKPFISFLKSLLNYNLVGEVILFNNDNINTNKELLKIKNDKLKIYDYDKNIGVNPAWNLGVKFAKYQYVCILNDDVIFDLSLFDKSIPYLEDRQTGVLGLCPGKSDFNQPLFEDGSIDITKWKGEHTYGFGCLMLINKKQYLTIPNELFLYYGDNYIFDGCLANNKTNYIISNITHFTPFAVTTSKVGNGFLDIETPIYEKELLNIKWALNIFNIEYEKALLTENNIKSSLPILYEYAYNIDSILEINTKIGLSTRMFLNANLMNFTTIDIKEDYYIRDLFNVTDIIHRSYKYIINDNLTYMDNERYDLLFINMNNEYNQIAKELENYAKYINKYIIFYSDSTESLPIILKFLLNNQEWELKKYNHSSNELIILNKREK